MLRHRLSTRAGAIALFLFLGHGLSSAGTTVIQTPPGLVTGTDGAVVGDTSEHPKFYTITASLREVYDDNIFTAHTDTVASFKTVFSPSILLDFPMENSDLSLRATGGITYYSNRGGDPVDYSGEFVARFNHAFSERFNLDLREQFAYTTEPNFLDPAGTLFRNGAYISNRASAEFVAQWTPLFGTVTTYANGLVNYQDNTVAFEQNYDENTVTQDFRFAILPKINLVFGGIFDDLSYTGISRGYQSYTGNSGLDWQALTSLTMGFRAGGTITDTVNSGTSTSPYAAATLNWQLGQRSALDFNYVHSVLPSDVVYAQGQVADRITVRFKYDITPSITAHFDGLYNHSDTTQSLIAPGTLSNFTEDDLGFGAGISYHFNSNVDFDTGYSYDMVSSQLSFRDYTRNQIYLGVRGTY